MHAASKKKRKCTVDDTRRHSKAIKIEQKKTTPTKSKPYQSTIKTNDSVNPIRPVSPSTTNCNATPTNNYARFK